MRFSVVLVSHWNVPFAPCIQAEAGSLAGQGNGSGADEDDNSDSDSDDDEDDDEDDDSDGGGGGGGEQGNGGGEYCIANDPHPVLPLRRAVSDFFVSPPADVGQLLKPSS